MWLIPEDSAAYDYTIPDDDIFYIMATSGIYANQSDAFDDLTTNWIGTSHTALTELAFPLDWPSFMQLFLVCTCVKKVNEALAHVWSCADVQAHEDCTDLGSSENGVLYKVDLTEVD